VFLGWGEEEREVEEAPTEPEKPETEGARRRTPAVMLAPALGLLLLAGVLGLARGTAAEAERSARLFQARQAYAAQVLEGRPAEPPARDEAPLKMLPGVLFGLAGAVGALLLPVLTLRRRLPQGSGAALRPLLRGLRSLHTGHVGDYVTWLVAGAACLGGLFAAMLR
jgi:multicomponent Na+:H+ antiporter subunit D